MTTPSSINDIAQRVFEIFHALSHAKEPIIPSPLTYDALSEIVYRLKVTNGYKEYVPILSRDDVTDEQRERFALLKPSARQHKTERES